MFYIKDIEHRINVVDKILKILKLGILNKKEKQEIYELVKSINKTELQKERFYIIYNIGPNENDHNTYNKAASFYNCTTGAVRSSVISVIVALYHLSDNKFSILENIFKKYEK